VPRAPSKSHSDSRWTSRMMHPCASATKPSINRSTSRAAER
jgi:hypothetical protein